MDKKTYEITVADHECPRPDGSTMLIRVAQPQGDGPFPAVIDIHGGGWITGDRNQNALIDDTLAANGIVAAAPEFRMPPVGKYPLSITDIHLATRWLKANAATFGSKPEWVGGVGASSGAHQMLCAMLLKPDDPRFGALALAQDLEPNHVKPMQRLLTPSPAGRSPIRYADGRWRRNATTKHLLDAHAEPIGPDEKARWRKAIRNSFWRAWRTCGKLPPLLVLQGTNDDNLPPDMASKFVSAYRKAGGDAVLQEFAGQIHGFVVPRSGIEIDRTLSNIVAFGIGGSHGG